MHEDRIAVAVRDPAFLARFWKKVEKTEGCWLWRGYRNPDGYGKVGHRSMSAHRIAWTATSGEIPRGMHVLHSCDNPPCCNPAHLWLGTHRENMADRDRKGRSNHAGEHNGRARLTTEDVAEIRRAAREGESRQSLALRFGVSYGTVAKIVTGQRWALAE